MSVFLFRTVVSDGDSTYTLDLQIPVKVIGVSDKPLKKDILVVANEDGRVSYWTGKSETASVSVSTRRQSLT